LTCSSLKQASPTFPIPEENFPAALPRVGLLAVESEVEVEIGKDRISVPEIGKGREHSEEKEREVGALREGCWKRWGFESEDALILMVCLRRDSPFPFFIEIDW